MKIAPRLREIGPGRICIAVLLATHLVVGIDAARRLSATHDEYWHLPAGLTAWRAGRFDADNLNPPLTRMWDTLPLLATSARVDSRVPPGDAFQLGDRFLTENRARYEVYLALARSMNVLFSVATGWLIAIWARDLFGMKSACLAVALWSFCPTALASAALVTPDAGATCLFTAALYGCWRFSNAPGWRWAVLLGAFLGLAQLAKFTNLLLYPLCIVTWFLVRARRADIAPVRPWNALRQMIAGAILSVVVLNAGYLFRGSFARLDAYRFQSQSMIAIAELLRPLARFPVPLPRDYVEGLDRQRQIMESAHPVYLDGQWSLVGFPDYYLRALAYKLPHAAQALVALAAVFVLVPSGVRRPWRTQWLLALPTILMIAVASSIGMQLGIRYVLPALPFLYLFASQAARWIDWRHFPLRTIVLVPLIAMLPASFRYHPHHLAFFNALSGGPVGGRQHLLDSNLDWGQDLGRLARYLSERRQGKIGLAYFGMLPPADLGIPYHLAPSWRPEPGWHAVSVNFEFGRPHTIRNPDGSIRSADFGEFGYFRDFEPVARIGYSIDVYHITSEDIARWRMRP
jgi:hypothetical protein